MKINIICSDKGWIYSKFVCQIGLYSKHKIFLNAPAQEKCDIQHLLPYYEHSKHTVHPFTIWSSHQERKEPLKSRFISVAKQAGWCLSPSMKYVKLLQEHGITKISQVRHGVDLNAFRPVNANCVAPKLIVGVVCRSYSSTSRKNEQLLYKIGSLDFVDLRITGGKIKEADMPCFYNDCNVIVQTSLIEGGSMAITEGLACGLPILCYSDVGVANEFEHGVLRVPFKDESAFIQRLKDFWTNKEYEDYRHPERIQQLRAQVETHTWANFVHETDLCFERAMDGQA